MSTLVSAVASRAAAPPSTASPLKKWLCQNPVVLKTSILALGLLGLEKMAEGIKKNSIYHIVSGITLLAIACALDKILPIFIPPAFNPNVKTFKPGECRGVTLSYEGDLPVLTISNKVSAHDAGYARGYLTAPQIKGMLEINNFAFFTLKGLPKNVPFLIEEMKKVIPKDYLSELEGLVEGYNKRRSEWVFIKGPELTLDNLIYFHLLPDIGNLDFAAANNWVQRKEEHEMGCSVIVDGNEGTGACAMRTLDWTSLGVYGTNSFVECRETTKGMRWIGQSFPLFIGTLTAMNDKGVCVAINTARGITDDPTRLPAAFYLRQLIENFSSVANVERYCLFHNPLGSFNLNVLDENEAKSIHFFQGENNSAFVRIWDQKKPLITLNYRYGEYGRANPNPPPSNSEQRQYEIETYYEKLHRDGKFEGTSVASRLKGLRTGPEVNNIRTITTIYLCPKERKMDLSFGNGYAGDNPLLIAPTQSWFSSKK